MHMDAGVQGSGVSGVWKFKRFKVPLCASPDSRFLAQQSLTCGPVVPVVLLPTHWNHRAFHVYNLFTILDDINIRDTLRYVLACMIC